MEIFELEYLRQSRHKEPQSYSLRYDSISVPNECMENISPLLLLALSSGEQISPLLLLALSSGEQISPLLLLALSSGEQISPLLLLALS